MSVFLLAATLQGKTMTLDNMLDMVSRSSYRIDLWQKQRELNRDKEKYYKLGDWNGVQTTASSQYSRLEDAWQTTGRAQWGPIYIEGTKDYDNDDYATIGVEKSLKDLIYSKNKSELKKLDLSKKVDELTYRIDMETIKANLISLYVEYKNNELELRVKQSGVKTLELEREKLTKSYDLGAVSKIELETLLMNLNNLNLESVLLKDNLTKLREQFRYIFGIDTGKLALADIPGKKLNYDGLVARYGQLDLQKQLLQQEITKESINYLNYDDITPDITVGLSRDTKNDENRVSLTFSKRFLDYNLDLEQEKLDLEQQAISYRQARLENEAEKQKILYNLASYENTWLVNKNKADLEAKNYEIKKLEYQNGKSTYLDVMESFNDYLEYRITAEKSRNSLYGYIYELRVKGEE
jgi:outer membrane protein TolC